MQQFTVRLEDDVMKKLAEKAESEGLPPAVLARNMITRQLALDFTSQQRDAMELLIRECIHDELKPVADRLAALAAKSGIMSASSWFMVSKLIDSVYGQQVDIKELQDDSRRKAITYIREREASE